MSGAATEGYCQCGCGEKTEISRWANKSKGLTKGQHLRFRSGHNRRLLGKAILSGNCLGCGKYFEVEKREGTEGKYCSQECYGHNHKGRWQSEDWQWIRKSRMIMKQVKSALRQRSS